MTEQEIYMKQALDLSIKAKGYTNPNPMVGCVVVKNHKVVAQGYHERCGEYHAERNALLNCKEDVSGADLYVTLEPCCHHGKTPPCTDIIIEKKIRRVYVGAMDSNPLVAGKGVQILKDAGIEVETGILEKECREVNEVFFHYMERQLPFVVMKYAMTLDGKIAAASGDSKWVTNEKSRAYVQELRKWNKGIMVGIETVLADDPMLTCRIAPDCNPVRIVCDSNLRIPLDCQLVKTASEIPTIVAYSKQARRFFDFNEMELSEGHSHSFLHKCKALERAGVELICVGEQKVDLKALLRILAKQNIDSILLEGGGTLNAGMLKENLVNRVVAFIAPKLIGGAKAKSPITGDGFAMMADAITLKDIRLQQFDEDYMITGVIE